MTLDFSRSSPPCARAAQHRALDRGRLLLRRAQAPLHRRAGQCRLPRADRLRHSRHDAARRLGAEAGRRLHRDHPARHRRRVRRLRQGRARARQRQRRSAPSTRSRSPASASERPALGDVLLLRRRARRQSGERRPQPRQQSDLDGDHPAGGNPGVALSGDVHAMGVAAGLAAAPAEHRGGLGAIYEIEALDEGGADVFLLGERGKFPPFGVDGGGRRRSTASSMRPSKASATPPLVSKITRRPASRAASSVRLETPGGGGFGDPLTRDPAQVARDVGSATCRARRRGATTASCSMPTARSTPTRPPGCARKDARMSAPSHRRRRCRRHVHRPVPVRRRDAARSRTAKVPSNRGNEAHGLHERPRRARRRRPRIGTDRARHHRRHQRAARAQGRAHRRHHHARLPRRARDAPPRPPQTWGLWGDFVPIADRDMRVEVDERTLADGTIRTPVDPAEVASAARRAAASKARRRSRIIFINAYANADNERRALDGRARRLAQRARHRLARGAAGDPRVRARLDHGAQRLSAAGRRRLSRAARSGAARRRASPAQLLHRAVERRRHVDRDRAATCRCAPRCRARPPA